MNMDMSPPSMTPSDHSMKDNMAMHMNLFWGKDVIILFAGWPGTSLGMYVLALCFVFLLALSVEFFSFSMVVKPGTNPVAGGLTQAAVYALRTALAYLIMLSVMSLNIGIFLVAVAGHTVGFFLVKCRALSMASRSGPDGPTTSACIPKV
ncbi:copper transporter 6-like [Cornus florida]|uniref:copper transporter 6-like n=1 Tax=Cornus florida TaxID=4283 RepID=UPI0028985549|nr:copper transporter 6-like [Cornus florida]